MATRPSPRLLSWPFILAIAVLMHVDWHLARPAHHRFSLEWSNHWIFAMLFFGGAGRYAAYRWHPRGWSAPLVNLAVALAAVPVLEGLIYDHRLTFLMDADRAHAFLLAIAAGIPAFLLMYGLMRSRFRPPPP